MHSQRHPPNARAHTRVLAGGDSTISQHRFPRLRELYLPENEIEVIEGLNGCPGLQKVRLAWTGPPPGIGAAR